MLEQHFPAPHAYEIGKDPIETPAKKGNEKLVLAVCALHKLERYYESDWGNKINELLKTGLYSAVIYLPTEKKANLASDWKQNLGINETDVDVFDGLEQWEQCLWSFIPYPKPVPRIQPAEQEPPSRRMCSIQ